MKKNRQNKYKTLVINISKILLLMLSIFSIFLIMFNSSQLEKFFSNKKLNTDKQSTKTIVIYRYSYWKPDETQILAVQEKINDYLINVSDVQIEIKEIRSADYATQLNMAMTSSDDVDLMWTASWCELSGTDELVKNNRVMDLTEIIKNYPTLYESMSEEVWDSSAYNGKMYFIPIYKEIAQGYDIMCKTSLAESMGWDLTSVHQLSDITPYLKQAKEAGIEYPYTCQNTANFNRYYLDYFDFIENYAGILKAGDTSKVINIVATSEYQEFCELMYNWAQAGYINESEFIKKTDLKLCYTDDYAFGLWTKVPNNQESCSERYGAKMSLISVTDKWISSNGALGSCYAVNANSNKAGLCLEFLELLYTDQYLADLWTWGIEGENYTRNSQGKILRNLTNNSYRHDVWETNTIKTPSLLVDEPDNKIILYDQFNMEGIISPAMGFRFDSSAVEAEYSAVENLEREFGYLLETGAIDPESGLPEYLDALEEAGLQIILNEMQRQYDIWKSN